MKHLMKFVRYGAMFLGVAALLLVGFATWTVKRQGADADTWKHYEKARVSFDEHGIPTIEADTWLDVIEAQGYVTASERLWQMELARRFVEGRLSEWFGAATFDLDQFRLQDDWMGSVKASWELLPENERRYCEAYVAGINQFIADHPNRWGIEFQLMGVQAENWQGWEVLAQVLAITEAFTYTAGSESRAYLWRKHLPDDWTAFLYPDAHPWSKPPFGEPGSELKLPSALPPWQPAGMTAGAAAEKSHVNGSNAWTYAGSKGAYLANDPHTEQTVPQIWYAVRLRVSDNDWAIGASLPGLPGIVAGINPSIGWGVTTANEDTDDYLEEQLSEDGKQYLSHYDENGEPVWRDLQIYEVPFPANPKMPSVTVRKTHRGPIAKRARLGDAWYSRQWLALQPGNLRMPTLNLMAARDWQSFGEAVADMPCPAINFLFMDRQGHMGHAVSGRTIERSITGMEPQSALKGEWKAVAKAEARPRRFKRDHGYFASANERLWADPNGNPWDGDERKARIAEVLSSGDDLDQHDMEALQLDTVSRFHRILLGWLADHLGPLDGNAETRVASWRAWDGDAVGNPKVFTDAVTAREIMENLLLDRVKQAFSIDTTEEYGNLMDTAWMLKLMTTPDGVRVFGCSEQDLAQAVFERLQAKGELPPYYKTNRFGGLHAVEETIGVDWFFGVDKPEQYGFEGLVRLETPVYGPSYRMVLNMTEPEQSTWAFPIGQSGHFDSPYYDDMQALWQKDTRLNLFTETHTWNLAPVVGNEEVTHEHE